MPFNSLCVNCLRLVCNKLKYCHERVSCAHKDQQRGSIPLFLARAFLLRTTDVWSQCTAVCSKPSLRSCSLQPRSNDHNSLLSSNALSEASRDDRSRTIIVWNGGHARGVEGTRWCRCGHRNGQGRYASCQSRGNSGEHRGVSTCKSDLKRPH